MKRPLETAGVFVRADTPWSELNISELNIPENR